MVSANHIARFFEMKYPQKGVNDEAYFWHADKNRSLLQVNTINLILCDKACPKYQKKEVCISLQYLKENMKDEVNFFPEYKH